jgi:hypothetical protein
MADCNTYNNVTAAVFACVKSTSASQHGTVYDPPDGNQGTATTSTPVGNVVVSFNLDTTNNAITYCLVSKPWVVPESDIWNGIASTITACQSNQVAAG